MDIGHREKVYYSKTDDQYISNDTLSPIKQKAKQHFYHLVAFFAYSFFICYRTM